MPAYPRACIIATLAVLAPASCRVDPYACDADTQCKLADKHGTCESAGWCAYPDDACATGARFSPHAGDGLADRCVERAEGSSSTGP